MQNYQKKNTIFSVGKKEKLSQIVAGLDIGSNNIICYIGKYVKPPRANEKHNFSELRLLGVGKQEAKGIKEGSIIDFREAEHAIRACVSEAEKNAELIIDSINVNVASNFLRSDLFSTKKEIKSGVIKENDIYELIDKANQALSAERRVAIHAIPIKYTLDNNQNVINPVGMYGKTLSADIHFINSEIGFIRNLKRCLDLSHLNVRNLVASQFASSLAVISEQEAKMGSICIDMGEGGTSLAVWHDNKLVHTSHAHSGGFHITLDLAKSLSISLEQAEKLKLLHGNVYEIDGNDDKIIEINQKGDYDNFKNSSIYISSLNRIINNRTKELLLAIKDYLAKEGITLSEGASIVLTGGGSQIPGMCDLAEKILKAKVRLGVPVGVKNLTEIANNTEFSTVSGLLKYHNNSPILADFETSKKHPWSNINYLTKIGYWIKESF